MLLAHHPDGTDEPKWQPEENAGETSSTHTAIYHRSALDVASPFTLTSSPACTLNTPPLCEKWYSLPRE
jgi:hypothetical protein